MAARVERIPTREELVCLVCRQPGPHLDIDHVQVKGMGGSKERDVPENKAPLCRPCHDAKHQRVLRTRVRDGVFEWTGRDAEVWIPVPVRVNERHGCLDFATEDPAAGEQLNRESPLQVGSATPAAGSGRGEAGSAAAEAGKQAGAHSPRQNRDPSRVVPARNRGPSAAAPSASPLSPAAEDREMALHGPPSFTPSAAGPFSQLTHDERMGIAAEIRREQKQRQWKAGDTANAWERETTEAWQYLDEFGYTHPALSNIMHICENIPVSRRHESLSYAHHAVIHTYNAEDQEAWLDRAEQEGWTVRDFRIAVHGEKPKPEYGCPHCDFQGTLDLFRRVT